MTQGVFEGVVGDLLRIGGVGGGLHATVDALGAKTQLWIENTGSGGSQWGIEAGNATLGANELFVGAYRAGSVAGLAGGPLEVGLILFNDGSSRYVAATNAAGIPTLGLRGDNGGGDPGFPYLRSDSLTLALNARGAGDLLLNPDTARPVYAQTTLNLDRANASAGGVVLGFGPFGATEGIGSKRTAGGNQGGLDFITAGLSRLVVANGGDVNAAVSLSQRGYRMPLVDHGRVASQAWANGLTTKSVTFQAGMFTVAPDVTAVPFGSGLSGANAIVGVNNIATGGCDILVQTSNTGLTFGLIWHAVGT